MRKPRVPENTEMPKVGEAWKNQKTGRISYVFSVGEKRGCPRVWLRSIRFGQNDSSVRLSSFRDSHTWRRIKELDPTI